MTGAFTSSELIVIAFLFGIVVGVALTGFVLLPGRQMKNNVNSD